MGETENPQIGIVVLAAGSAARMKQPKQLLPYRGSSLLRRAAETAIVTECQPIIVVLGANFERVNAEIKDLPVEIRFNENYESGLSSSIVEGLREMLKIAPEISAAVITLADQPLITAANINILITRFRTSQKPIAAAEYDQKVGVPAIFAQSLFAELFKLSGDQGARKLLRENSHLIEKVQMSEAAFDVDTPEQYARLTESA